MKIIWSVRLPFVSNSEKCSTSVQRMAQKTTPFPVTDEGYKARPVFISLPILETKTYQKLNGVFWAFVSDPTEQDKIPCLKRFFDMENSDQCDIRRDYYSNKSNIRYSFLDWLLKQGRQQMWHPLVREEANFIDNRTKLSPGCYPPFPNNRSVELLVPSIAGYFNRFRNPDLNPERVKKAFGEPSALVITDDLLCTAYREYLQTMDWSQLLKD